MTEDITDLVARLRKGHRRIDFAGGICMAGCGDWPCLTTLLLDDRDQWREKAEQAEQRAEYLETGGAGSLFDELRKRALAAEQRAERYREALVRGLCSSHQNNDRTLQEPCAASGWPTRNQSCADVRAALAANEVRDE